MSLSRIRQERAFRPLKPSKLHTDGFHCSFTFEPLKCHICELIPREAYTVNCCERNYCEVCISSLHQNYSTCPGCGQTITYSPNKKYNDVILRFEVYCKNRCGWKGPLGKHDSHLNIDPLDNEWLNGCPTVTVSCIHCKKWNPFKNKRKFFLAKQGLETTFSTSKLDVIYSITHEVRSLWYNVGVALGCKEQQLKAIQQCYPKNSERYRQLLTEWIESGKEANWSKLLQAFRKPSVRFENLSRKVERMIVCGVVSEQEVKQLEEEAVSLLKGYMFNKSTHTQENMKKCYQSLKEQIRYLEWEEDAKLLDKGYGGSQRKHYHTEENEGDGSTTAIHIISGATGATAGIGIAGTAATSATQFIAGGLFLGSIGLAGGIAAGVIIVALSAEQKLRRKRIEDKYTKLLDRCKEKIEELRPKIGR